MCITIPVVYAAIVKPTTVDIVIHVPKGFIKPGIQVFFSRQYGGQVNTDGWLDNVLVSEFGMHINELLQKFVDVSKC
jgi:hypothetical protein